MITRWRIAFSSVEVSMYHKGSVQSPKREFQTADSRTTSDPGGALGYLTQSKPSHRPSDLQGKNGSVCTESLPLL